MLRLLLHNLCPYYLLLRILLTVEEHLVHSLALPLCLWASPSRHWFHFHDCYKWDHGCPCILLRTCTILSCGIYTVPKHVLTGLMTHVANTLWLGFGRGTLRRLRRCCLLLPAVRWPRRCSLGKWSLSCCSWFPPHQTFFRSELPHRAVSSGICRRF